LLQALRGKKRPVTAAVLAAQLEVSERTLYRDIAELTALGAPIFGEAGVGYVLRSGLFLPPLMLNAEETEAIVLGLRYVDQRGDDVLSHAAANALAKLPTCWTPPPRKRYATRRCYLARQGLATRKTAYRSMCFAKPFATRPSCTSITPTRARPRASG